jgi:hypothetical protein
MTDETRSVLYMSGGVVVGTVSASLIVAMLATIRMVRETSVGDGPGHALASLIVMALAFALFVFVALSALTLAGFWEAAR